MRQSFVPSRDLLDLQTKVSSSQFVLPGEDRDSFTELQDKIVTQLSDYVVPALSSVERPTIVVVAGSTGAGKSMLVNSLVQENVSESGVLRPTTKQPVLLLNKHDKAFVQDHKLGELCKVTVRDEVAPGLIVIDAPDVDSISAENRRVATELMRNADVWLFVTTARRYADQVPWQILREGAGRNVPLAIVANRIPEADAAEILADIEIALDAEGLGDTPLFPVLECPGVTLLSPEDVTGINSWMADIIHEKNRTLIRQQAIGAQLKHLRHDIDTLNTLLSRQGIAASKMGDRYVTQLGYARERLSELVDPDSSLGQQLQAAWLTSVDQGGGLDHLLKPLGPLRTWRGRRPAQQLILEQANRELVAGVKNWLSEALWDAYEPIAKDVAELRPEDSPEPDLQWAFGEQVVTRWQSVLLANIKAAMDAATGTQISHVQRVRKVTSPADLQAVASYACFGVRAAQTLLEHLIPGAMSQVVSPRQQSLATLALENFEEVARPLGDIAEDEDVRGMYAAKLRLSLLLLKDLE